MKFLQLLPDLSRFEYILQNCSFLNSLPDTLDDFRFSCEISEGYIDFTAMDVDRVPLVNYKFPTNNSDRFWVNIPERKVGNHFYPSHPDTLKSMENFIAYNLSEMKHNPEIVKDFLRMVSNRNLEQMAKDHRSKSIEEVVVEKPLLPVTPYQAVKRMPRIGLGRREFLNE